MDLISWSDDYLTGLTAIDTDHRMLFALVNDLNARVTSGDRSGIGLALQTLSDYVDYHFAREEKAMEAAGYQDLVAHVKRHRKLAETVESLVLMHAENPDALDGEEVMTFLGGWLTGHILESDMAYVPHLRDADVD